LNKNVKHMDFEINSAFNISNWNIWITTFFIRYNIFKNCILIYIVKSRLNNNILLIGVKQNFNLKLYKMVFFVRTKYYLFIKLKLFTN